MRIQDLPRNVRATRRIGKVDPSRIVFIHEALNKWFNGFFMQHYPRTGEAAREYNFSRYRNALFSFRNLYEDFLPKSPIKLYRYRDTHLDVNVGEKRKLKTGTKRVQSWTTSVKSAENFYKEVGWTSRYKSYKLYRRTPIVIGSVFDPLNVVATFKAYEAFLMDTMALGYDDKITHLFDDEHDINASISFWKEQKEVIVDVTPARIVRVEKIITDL